MLDGLALKDGFLYVSDWAQSKKPGALRRIRLSDGEVFPIAGEVELDGPADFCFSGEAQILLPSMVGKCLHVLPIPPSE